MTKDIRLCENFHIHTYLCHHAKGTMREYVERALEAGFTRMGFSDHVPYPFPDDYSSWFRMSVGETEKYVQSVEELREEFAGQIEIFTGYEAEYYPKHFKDMLGNLKKFRCDYLILGQHFTNNEYDGLSTWKLVDDEELLEKYYDQLIEGVKTGVFTYIAHPDIPDFKGDRDFYLSQFERVCRASVEYDIPIELNLQGVRRGRHYPIPEFYSAAHDTGCKVVIGLDAHEPEAMYNEEHLKYITDIVERYDLNYVSHLDLIKPF